MWRRRCIHFILRALFSHLWLLGGRKRWWSGSRYADRYGWNGAIAFVRIRIILRIVFSSISRGANKLVNTTEVTFTNLSLPDYVAFLVSLGLPESFATVLADSDRGAAEGELYVDPADLERLLGRPATSLVDAVKAALA